MDPNSYVNMSETKECRLKSYMSESDLIQYFKLYTTFVCTLHVHVYVQPIELCNIEDPTFSRQSANRCIFDVTENDENVLHFS
jgi:hypothetical protein